MNIFPVYNLNCTKDRKQEFLLNPYEEFLQYCYNTYYNKTGPEKSIVDLYKSGKYSYASTLIKIGTCVNGLAIYHNDAYDKFDKTENAQFILIDENDKKIGFFELYAHGPYVKDFTDYTKRVTLYINFRQLTEWNNLNVNPDYNVLIFDNADLPGTLNMFISVLYGLSDFMNFVRYYKTRNITAKTIDVFMKKITENNSALTYLVSYNISNFTLSVMNDDKIYTGTYEYNNYIENLKEFKNKLTSVC